MDFLYSKEQLNSIISIAYITKDRPNELIESINSCIKNISVTFDIYIYDNNSQIQNTNIILAFLESNKLNYCYYISKENKGVSHCRNFLYRNINSEYIFFLDDDAYLLSKFDFLNRILPIFNKYKISAITSISIDRRFKHSIIPFSYAKDPTPIDFEIVRSYVGFNHIIRKIKEIDYLYPDNLIYGSEELYFSMASFRLGYNVAYVNSYIVEHKPSLTNRVIPKDAYINGTVNSFLIKSYFVPTLLFPLSFIIFLLRLIKKFIFHPKNIFEAIISYAKRRQKKYILRFSLFKYLNFILLFGIKDAL